MFWLTNFVVSLGRYHSTTIITSENGNGSSHTEEDTAEEILKKENSAAGIFCWLKANAQTSNLALAKDAVGVVATLARVESDDLSRSISVFILPQIFDTVLVIWSRSCSRQYLLWPRLLNLPGFGM